MLFRIAGYGNLELLAQLGPVLPQARDQFDRVAKPARVLLERGTHAFGRIAAQRNNMPNAGIPVAVGHVEHFSLRRRHAGQVRGG